MKNVILGLLIGAMALIVASGSAFAAVNLVTEAEIDVTLEKEYEIGSREAELSSQTYLIGTKIELGEKLSLTPKIGIWNSEIEDNTSIIENAAGIALGIDGEYELIKIAPATISLIGSYLYGDSEIDAIETKGIATVEEDHKIDVDLTSYEVGLRAAFETPLNLTPYVGVVYSDSTLKLNYEGTEALDDKYDAEDNIGLRFGLTGSPVENLTLNLEGKVLDENGFTVSGIYRF